MREKYLENHVIQIFHLKNLCIVQDVISNKQMKNSIRKSCYEYEVQCSYRFHVVNVKYQFQKEVRIHGEILCNTVNDCINKFSIVTALLKTIVQNTRREKHKTSFN